MNLLFVHDHRFKKVNNSLYSNGGLNDDVLNRYTDVFDNVIVAARIESANNGEAYSKISNRNIEIKDTYMDFVALQNLIKQSDAVIFRLPSKQGIVAIKYAKKYKKPYLVELVGCPWDAYWNHSFKGKIIAPIIRYLTKRAVKGAPYVVYVSEEFLQRRYPTNGKTLACSDVQLNAFDDMILEKRLAKIDKMKDEIVLGTAAAVNVKYKGQHYVIRAIAKLKKEGYNIRYRLAGGGNQAFLKNVARKYEVSDCVEFCGSIPHDEIFNFYDEIDIYVHPSITEGLPRVLVEAMSRGCPAMGTNVGGIPELVDEKYLFEKKNIGDICNKIISILDCRELKKEAKRSYERAKNFEKVKLESNRNSFYDNFKNRSININD